LGHAGRSLLEHTVVVPGAATDFIMFPGHSDPVLQQGPFPLPKKNKRELEKVLSVCNFPAIFIAHEIPKWSWRGDPTPFIVPPHPKDSVRLSQALGSLASGLLSVLQAPVIAGRQLAPAAGAGAGLLGIVFLPAAILTLGLDPLVIGALRTPKMNMWQYFVLTGWRW